MRRSICYSAKLGATPEYQAVASGLSISVNVATDAGAVGTITTSPITITGGANFASTQFHAVGVGSTNITASSVGYTSGSVLATVQLPQLVVGGGFSIGQHLQQDTTLILPVPAPSGGVDVTLQSTSPSLLVLSASPTAAGTASITLHMAAGSQFATYYLQSLGSAGSASYTASAPTGYSPATGTVALAPFGCCHCGASGASNITIPLSGGAIPLSVKVGYLDGTGAPVAEQALAGGPNLVVTLQNTTPATGTVPGTVDDHGWDQRQDRHIYTGTCRNDHRLRSAAAGLAHADFPDASGHHGSMS